MRSTFVKQLNERGYSDPFKLISYEQINSCLIEAEKAGMKYPQFSNWKQNPNYTLEKHWEDISEGKPWFKNFHVVCPSIVEIAKHKVLLDILKELYGSEVVLWSSQVICKFPNENHDWHIDIETNYWDSVNVWIGLENTNHKSGLKILEKSHQHNKNLDCLDAHSNNINPFLDPSKDLSIVKPVIFPSECILFYGSTLHGSYNSTSSTRKSLLLQFSPINENIKIPTCFTEPVIWHEKHPKIIKLF